MSLEISFAPVLHPTELLCPLRHSVYFFNRQRQMEQKDHFTLRWSSCQPPSSSFVFLFLCLMPGVWRQEHEMGRTGKVEMEVEQEEVAATIASGITPPRQPPLLRACTGSSTPAGNVAVSACEASRPSCHAGAELDSSRLRGCGRGSSRRAASATVVMWTSSRPQCAAA
jgi:hypothetical protein